MIVPVIGLIVGIVIGAVGSGVGLDATLIFLILWTICAVLSAAFMGIGLYIALNLTAKHLENFGERKFTVRKGARMKTGSGYLPPRGGLMR